MKKKYGKMGSTNNLTEGLQYNCPSSSDKSTDLKLTPTVDSGAARKSTAPTPKTLGPRTA